MTHNLGSPRPYPVVCRELYRHDARIRQESPLPMPATLRPWVRLSGRVAWWLMLALLAAASIIEWNGY